MLARREDPKRPAGLGVSLSGLEFWALAGLPAAALRRAAIEWRAKTTLAFALRRAARCSAGHKAETPSKNMQNRGSNRKLPARERPPPTLMRTIDTHSSALGSCALIHPAALSFPLFNAAIKQTSQKESGAGAAAAAGNVQCDVRYSPEPRPPRLPCSWGGVVNQTDEIKRKVRKKHILILG